MSLGKKVNIRTFSPRAAEKVPLSDQVGNPGRNHAFPGLVACGDFLENVAREDAEVFRLEVVQRDEAAAVGKVAVEFLQFR